VPNTELGHVYLRNQKTVAEKYVSNLQRKSNNWSWNKFGRRFNVYLVHIERLFSPDLIILGGGGSKYFENFESKLTVTCPVKPAQLLNQAGTVGAAYYAYLRQQRNMDLID
jgi:polyphosphate glucokinase